MTVRQFYDLPLRYVLSVPTDKESDVEMPLVVVMHGRGADAKDLVDLAPELDNGYRFVFPNAPKRFEPTPGVPMGFTWFNGWPPELNSFQEARKLLLRFLAEVLTRYRTPSGKVIISGFSQGGMMALDVAYRSRVMTAGTVVMSGALNDTDIPPLAEKRGLPLLIVHGTADDMIPIAAARRTREILETFGIAPEYHEFDDMGHYVTPESLAVVRDFIRRCVDPQPDFYVPELTVQPPEEEG